LIGNSQRMAGNWGPDVIGRYLRFLPVIATVKQV
jgi:hypothetical protein